MELELSALSEPGIEGPGAGAVSEHGGAASASEERMQALEGELAEIEQQREREIEREIEGLEAAREREAVHVEGAGRGAGAGERARSRADESGRAGA